MRHSASTELTPVLECMQACIGSMGRLWASSDHLIIARTSSDKPLSEPWWLFYWHIYASLGLNELTPVLECMQECIGSMWRLWASSDHLIIARTSIKRHSDHNLYVYFQNIFLHAFCYCLYIPTKETKTICFYHGMQKNITILFTYIP